MTSLIWNVRALSLSIMCGILLAIEQLGAHVPGFEAVWDELKSTNSARGMQIIKLPECK